jgi:hypothetical protein
VAAAVGGSFATAPLDWSAFLTLFAIADCVHIAITVSFSTMK